MRRTRLPDQLDSVFRVGEGLAAGLSSSRMRGADLHRPHRGIRTTSPVTTPVEVALAFLPRLPERAFFIGATAARLHGLPLPVGIDDSRLDVGVRAGDARVTAAGIRSHHVRIGDRDIVRVRGAAVTTPERTWCDLAARGLDVGQLVAVGDRLIWRRDPLTTLEEMTGALQRYDGRRGARVMRLAMPLLSSRSDSAPESEIRVAIVQAGLPAPRVNVAVLDARGRFVATPDLTWPSRRIAVEYEGDHHRTDRAQWHEDIERMTRLQILGWTVIRATAADYRDPARLLIRLAGLLSNP